MDEPWVPNSPNSHLISFNLCLAQEGPFRKVSQLLNPDGTWNIQLLQGLFRACTMANIYSNIIRPVLNREDKMIWLPCSNGDHTTKLAYLLLMWDVPRLPNPHLSEWKTLWRVQIHERHKPLLRKLA